MKTNFKTFLESESEPKSIEQFVRASESRPKSLTYKGSVYYPSGPFNQVSGEKGMFWQTKKEHGGPGITHEYTYHEIVVLYPQRSNKPCAALEWQDEPGFVGTLIMPREYAEAVLGFPIEEENKDRIVKRILMLYKNHIKHDEDNDVAQDFPATKEGMQFLIKALKQSGLKWPELEQIEKSLT